ncbi:MAG: hypothetical protein JWN37_857 [Candidatus Nomurabacteria bacterium]|nr:hypothetical protein [Candidatus Nomurabacteria bacterium]
MPRKKVETHDQHVVHILTGLIIMLLAVVVIDSFFIFSPRVANKIHTITKCVTSECTKTKDEVLNATTESNGSTVTFNYLSSLGNIYILPVTWPPKLEIVDDESSCTIDINKISENKKVESKVINGHTYCISTVSEGAEGRTHAIYTYTFPHKEADTSHVMRLTVDLLLTSCNYADRTNKEACERKSKSFDLDNIVDHMMQTVKVQ